MLKVGDKLYVVELWRKVRIVSTVVVQVTAKQVKIGTVGPSGHYLRSPIAFACRTTLTVAEAERYATTPRQAVKNFIRDQQVEVQDCMHMLAKCRRQIARARAMLKRKRLPNATSGD